MSVIVDADTWNSYTGQPPSICLGTVSPCLWVHFLPRAQAESFGGTASRRLGPQTMRWPSLAMAWTPPPVSIWNLASSLVAHAEIVSGRFCTNPISSHLLQRRPRRTGGCATRGARAGAWTATSRSTLARMSAVCARVRLFFRFAFRFQHGLLCWQAWRTT